MMSYTAQKHASCAVILHRTQQQQRNSQAPKECESLGSSLQLTHHAQSGRCKGGLSACHVVVESAHPCKQAGAFEDLVCTSINSRDHFLLIKIPVHFGETFKPGAISCCADVQHSTPNAVFEWPGVSQRFTDFFE